MIVAVKLLDGTGTSFLTTLSPKALPVDKVPPGFSKDRYLEIDSTFAQYLGFIVKDTDVSAMTRYGGVFYCVSCPMYRSACSRS